MFETTTFWCFCCTNAAWSEVVEDPISPPSVSGHSPPRKDASQDSGWRDGETWAHNPSSWCWYGGKMHISAGTVCAKKQYNDVSLETGMFVYIFKWTLIDASSFIWCMYSMYSNYHLPSPKTSIFSLKISLPKGKTLYLPNHLFSVTIFSLKEVYTPPQHPNKKINKHQQPENGLTEPWEPKPDHQPL